MSRSALARVASLAAGARSPRDLPGSFLGAACDDPDMTTTPSGYQLVDTAPPLDRYLALRRDSGLTPVTAEQGAAALPGSWFACHVVREESGDVVGMGRLIGDGGWYFVVADMAVLPAHQRRGLGDAVLARLLDEVRARVPAGAYVSLMADEPGRRLYERHGFTVRAPHTTGMARWLS